MYNLYDQNLFDADLLHAFSVIDTDLTDVYNNVRITC